MPINQSSQIAAKCVSEIRQTDSGQKYFKPHHLRMLESALQDDLKRNKSLKNICEFVATKCVFLNENEIDM